MERDRPRDTRDKRITMQGNPFMRRVIGRRSNVRDALPLRNVLHRMILYSRAFKCLLVSSTKASTAFSDCGVSIIGVGSASKYVHPTTPAKGASKYKDLCDELHPCR
jgi:hypothetical protein